MPDDEKPFVYAVSRVLDVERIDGGRTLALRLARADGYETVILVPCEAARDLADRLIHASSNRADRT